MHRALQTLRRGDIIYPVNHKKKRELGDKENGNKSSVNNGAS